MSSDTDEKRIEEFKSILSVAALKMTIPIYLAFVATDYLFVPQYFTQFMLMRIATAIIVFIIYLLSKKITSIKQAEHLILILAAVVALPITIMIWVSGDIASPYYAGLNLVATGGISFLPRTVKNLIIMLLVIFGPYIFSIPFFDLDENSFNRLIINLFFMISTGMVAFMVNYYSNLLRKKETSAREELEVKINEVDEKNRSLIKIGELATQVAHDIRSPVGALQAVSQMLSEEVDPRKKKLIENAAKRINDIADNLVSQYRDNLTKDLSSVEIDRNITLNSLVDDIIEEKKLSLDLKNKIIFKAPESIPIPKNLNSTEFQRLISNLINNSIEALDKEYGLVEISLANIGGKISIQVTDNGSGISSEYLKKIFEKGFSSKAAGTGLGLSHAKEYITSLGGHLNVESSTNQGTSIKIIF